MRIAIEGCCHGELDKIFATIKYIQDEQDIVIDLLVICGDFQAIRNTTDLATMACPAKYRQMGTFYEYYSGRKVPPCPVLFIGGNHEASNFLWELYHGGWVSKGIMFMGWCGVVNFGGVRIAGLSGIYKQPHYESGHFEMQPFDHSDSRSIYHVRKLCVFKLAQITQPIDIFLSHDWPRNIAIHGDHEKLVSIKRFLAEEIRNNTLGSVPNEFLLKKLKPLYWFCAHMHVKFAALYEHEVEGGSSQPVVANPDEINLDDDDSSDDDHVQQEEPKKSFEKPQRQYTKFLALDKCIGDRSFIQVVEIEPRKPAPYKFEYDAEWLAIVKSTNNCISFDRIQPPLPTESEIKEKIVENTKWVHENFGDLGIPDNFKITAPSYGASESVKTNYHLKPFLNNQTATFCERLDIPNFFNPGGVKSQ